jgi:hypothetical protein
VQKVRFLKDPSDEVDFGFDWSLWLFRRGLSVISSSSWEVWGSDAALIVMSGVHAPYLVDGNKACVFLSAGTPKIKYTVTNRITAGVPVLTAERSFEVWVTDL